ncbi:MULTISPECIES: hypothetical protein [Alphaproteobacteria]|uniref:Uncharacterized protein n=2 Tax=Alphaproteobacteria TaxID=28211 RepID=A0A512HCH7_9HYPH|nr:MULTISPECIES: hypothetical protein [Alphaproteobacteria]GEO83153.1 hypothetical protein RNA01_00850 [Ciceribacter naphthalenivorans]GLR20452.1 hypothetical protein GCM10007920_02360 [Ciceribacter naphthalenivorans]GLT03308.1 hypothetical protein GCM10007926_02360 [Sphingomonas psychrolutea]
MSPRFFSSIGRTAVLSVAAIIALAPVADAASRDKRFFESVAGVWKGPGEIVAGKYKGTKFSCSLTGLPADGKLAGLTLDGTCRVGVFSQPMKATIAEVDGKYQGQFLDGADGKGMDIVSGAVTGDRVVMGINRNKLNGAMVARLQNDSAMNITISVKVEDRLIPVIGLKLNRQADAYATTVKD